MLAPRVAIGFVIDHIFAPRVLTTVSIGGAVACILYAVAPNYGYVSALLIGFLLGAEFDVLAFLIKRYYGNLAYGRIYGVIFGLFYLGSGIGIATFVLIVTGGALYTVGGVVYGFKRPNPWPRWFGFHEVFHTFTILAFVTHYIGVSLAVYSLR